MNGLLSEPQEFVLETLRQFNALRLNQIKWLLQTKYKDRYGAYVGCDVCVEIKDAWEVEDCFPERSYHHD